MKTKSQDRYLSYLEFAGDGIIITDGLHRIEYMNPKAMDIMELEETAVKNRKLQEFLKIHSKDSEEIFNRLIHQCIIKKEPVGLTEGTTFQFSSGRTIFASASISPRIKEDQSLEFVWVFRDITQIVKKEEELKEKNRELQIYREIFEQAQNIILMIDMEGNIIKANPLAEKIYGYTLEEFLDVNITEIHNTPTVLESIKESSRVHKKVLRCTHTKKDGSTFPVDINTIYIDVDNQRYLLGVIEDQSLREAQRRDIVAAKRKAEKANRAKNEFLANMSHEIRTPISGIMGMTELLLREQDKFDQEQVENLRIIKSSSENLLNTMNDVLDFSKIEAGHLKLEKKEFYLSEVLHNLEKNYRRLAGKKNIEFSIRNNTDLSQRIYGDVHRLYQILNNLLTNAVKFTEEGSVSLLIEEVSGNDHNITLQFSVIDTGRGIAKSMVNQVFKPFTQESTTYNRDTGGVGLGLSITKKLCSAMDGKIGVFTEVNKGSHFWVVLDFETLSKPKEEKNIQKNYQSIRGLEVLLVEDFSANQRMLRRFLTPYDMSIDIAENGKVALEKYLKKKYDIILMDIQMPVMDGIQATQAIREIEKNKKHQKTPIIALTAHALSGDGDHFMRHGMDGYISKPYRVNDLLDTMEEQYKISQSKSHLMQYLNEKEEKKRRYQGDSGLSEIFPWINEKLKELRKAFNTMNLEKIEDLGRALKEMGSENNHAYLEEEAFRLMLCIRRQDYHQAITILEELEEYYR